MVSSMSSKTKERIHRVYGICLSVLIPAVGGAFALSCLSIYRSGTSPFTREAIATHFDRIAILVYVCIAGVLGGIVLSLVFPLEGGKVKSRRDSEVTLYKLSSRLDLSVCDAGIITAIRRERTLRRTINVATVALSAGIMIPALIWCVNSAHFSIENLNGDIRTAAALVLPCAAVALGLWVAATLLCGASVARQTEVVKSALADSKGKITIQENTQNGKTEKREWMSKPCLVWSVRGVILAVGILFIILGVRNGGMADVLGKAVRICTECIGLG